MDKNDKDKETSLDDAYFKKARDLVYSMAEVDPQFAKALADPNLNARLLEGLKAGKEDFEREQREREGRKAEVGTPKWLQRDPVRNTFNDKSSRNSREEY